MGQAHGQRGVFLSHQILDEVDRVSESAVDFRRRLLFHAKFDGQIRVRVVGRIRWPVDGVVLLFRRFEKVSASLSE